MVRAPDNHLKPGTCGHAQILSGSIYQPHSDSSRTCIYEGGHSNPITITSVTQFYHSLWTKFTSTRPAGSSGGRKRDGPLPKGAFKFRCSVRCIGDVMLLLAAITCLAESVGGRTFACSGFDKLTPWLAS